MITSTVIHFPEKVHLLHKSALLLFVLKKFKEPNALSLMIDSRKRHLRC